MIDSIIDTCYACLLDTMVVAEELQVGEEEEIGIARDPKLLWNRSLEKTIGSKAANSTREPHVLQGQKVYAVCRSFILGLCNIWEECRQQVDCYSKAKFRGF
jgi:hypothetical protein